MNASANPYQYLFAKFDTQTRDAAVPRHITSLPAASANGGTRYNPTITIIATVNANKNNGYATADHIARFMRLIPLTTRPTFSSDINKLLTFPDVNNNVSSPGTQPDVAWANVIPRSRFFCISRIAIAKGSFGLCPLCDSIISIRCKASINVKLFRKSDAILRVIAMRFSVSVLKTNFA